MRFHLLYDLQSDIGTALNTYADSFYLNSVSGFLVAFVFSVCVLVGTFLGAVAAFKNLSGR